MFECDKCGLCCRILKKSKIYEELDRGDGCCIYFDEHTNLCNIYNERPLICRVDDMYKEYFSKVMTKEQYYEENYNACKKIKNQY